MAKKSLKIIAVGTLKTAHWKNAAEHYKKRIQHWCQIDEVIVKDGQSALPIAKRKSFEAQKIISNIQSTDLAICLDEGGKSFTSKEFASFLGKISDNSSKTPCFIIGGAFGLDVTVLNVSAHRLALGTMTLPHELAKVLLLEQLYRAESILRNTPYHH